MTALVSRSADDGACGAAVASSPIALARAELLKSHAYTDRKILFHMGAATKTF
jgi:hypothetical protein